MKSGDGIRVADDSLLTRPLAYTWSFAFVGVPHSPSDRSQGARSQQGPRQTGQQRNVSGKNGIPSAGAFQPAALRSLSDLTNLGLAALPGRELVPPDGGQTPLLTQEIENDG